MLFINFPLHLIIILKPIQVIYIYTYSIVKYLPATSSPILTPICTHVGGATPSPPNEGWTKPQNETTFSHGRMLQGRNQGWGQNIVYFLKTSLLRAYYAYRFYSVRVYEIIIGNYEKGYSKYGL